MTADELDAIRTYKLAVTGVLRGRDVEREPAEEIDAIERAAIAAYKRAVCDSMRAPSTPRRRKATAPRPAATRRPVRPLARRREQCGTARRRSRASSRTSEPGDDPPASPARLLIGGAP